MSRIFLSHSSTNNVEAIVAVDNGDYPFADFDPIAPRQTHGAAFCADSFHNENPRAAGSGGALGRCGRPRVGFKQTNLVAGTHGRDREPNGERALAGAALARDQSNRVHGAFAHSLRVAKVRDDTRQIAYASLNKLLTIPRAGQSDP